MRKLLVVALVATLLTTSGLSAHHSTAMFDQTRTVTLEGTVVTFQWTNPHAWIQVQAPGPDGEMAEWSIECASPNTLSRRGWTPRMLTQGQSITIVINPMQDGTNAGLFVGMTLDDGQVFGDVSAAGAGGQG